MFKRIVSFSAILALLLAAFPATTLAADINSDLIQSVVLTVPEGNAQAFMPANNQTLNIRINYAIVKGGGSLNVKITKDNVILQSTTAIVDLDPARPTDLNWNGKEIVNTPEAQTICGNQGAACPAGDYTVTATVTAPGGGNDTLREVETATFKIGVANTINIDAFTLTPTPPVAGGTFDPSASGENQDLVIFHDLSVVPDSGNIEIKNSKNEVMRTFNVALQSANDNWDGISETKLVPPGSYSATITVIKAGVASSEKRDFVVAYNNVNKGEIQNFTVDPASFDPDVKQAKIGFTNSKAANITVEIFDLSGSKIRTFSDYLNKDYGASTSHEIFWNGKRDSGDRASVGNYKVIVTTRNDFGVVVEEKAVALDNSEGSIPTNNAHISGISLRPSTTFEPAEDEDLEIEFDVEMDLDKLTILAVGGGDPIEIYSEEDIDEENNVQVSWDGTDENSDDDDDDDSDYADPGDWEIRFVSEREGTTLKAKAEDDIKIKYEKPEIRDFFVSKAKFDNDIGEFTYAIFRIDADAEVTITELQDNDEEDDVIEDVEVEKDRWYAVKWDGGSFDYNDDMDLKLIAENKINSSVFDTDKISVDLAEDTESNNRADIINDYIEPVVTAGNEKMVIYYETDDDADIKVTILSGKTSSGTEKIKFEINNQEAGEHSISWDGRDKNGNKLAAGFYSYKIVSKAGGTDTETGIFVVGSVGDVDGSGSGDDGDDDDDDDGGSGGCIPGVVIDGRSCDDRDDDDDDDGDDDDVIEPPILDTCGSFTDVMAEDSRCEAIQWVEAEGIFKGYADGTFRADQNINRVELLKVILEAMSEGPSVAAGNLGFKDVQPGAWYMGYIARAKTLGVFSGDAGKGTARPGDYINRVESLKILAETLRATKGFKVPVCEDVNYSDVSKTGWFFNYVCFNEQYSLFEEVSLMIFSPGRPASRGELAEALFDLHLSGLL